MTAPAFGQLLGFSDDELVLNRAGRLSPRQAEALRVARRGGNRYLIFVLLFMVAFVVVILAVVVPKATKHSGTSGSSNVNVTPIIIGVLAFVALVVGLSMARTRARLRRLASGVVLAVSGPARTKARRMGGNVNLDAGGGGYGGGMRYELSIGATTFFVRGPDVLAAFDDGGTFRAYYAAGGGHAVMNRLLSIEPIG
jgi:hypothetical protein